MRDVRSGISRTTSADTPRRGLVRATMTWIVVAMLLLGGAGLAAVNSVAGRPSEAAAAANTADWLWMNGPVTVAQPLAPVAQDDEGTPAVVGLTPAASDNATASAASSAPSSSPSASASPDQSGTCYLPNREATAPTPSVPSGTPTSAGATPVALNGTPVASASPDTNLTRAGYPAGPASDAVTEDIEHVVDSVSVCLSESDFDNLNELVEDDFRGQLLGVGEPVAAEDFAVYAGELPPTAFTVVDVSDVTVTDGGDATAVVQYLVGNQLRQGLWTFSLFSASASFLGEVDANGIVRASARWVVSSEDVQTPDVPDNAQSVDVTLDEYSIDVDPDNVDEGTVALRITNDGDQDHEVIVLRLEDDATASELLYIPGPDLPDGISIAGQLTVPAGDDGVMVLNDLDSGSYALVDLFPDDESGVPNLSLGMEADFQVGD